MAIEFTSEAEELPEGVLLRRLQSNPDERGVLTEIFRADLSPGFDPVQWNLVSSEAGVLRGVHVHVVHQDYLIITGGHATIGLRDLRRDSATAGWAGVVEMNGDELSALTIPTGVAHGFYFHLPSQFIYGVTSYWNRNDELGCHWADPALEIPWPVSEAKLSERDATAGSLAELVEEFQQARRLVLA